MAVHRRSLPLALSGFLFLVVDLHRPHAHRIRFLIRRIKIRHVLESDCAVLMLKPALRIPPCQGAGVQRAHARGRQAGTHESRNTQIRHDHINECIAAALPRAASPDPARTDRRPPVRVRRTQNRDSEPRLGIASEPRTAAAGLTAHTAACPRHTAALWPASSLRSSQSGRDPGSGDPSHSESLKGGPDSGRGERKPAGRDARGGQPGGRGKRADSRARECFGRPAGVPADKPAWRPGVPLELISDCRRLGSFLQGPARSPARIGQPSCSPAARPGPYLAAPDCCGIAAT